MLGRWRHLSFVHPRSLVPAEGQRWRRSPYLLVLWEGEKLVVLHCDTLRRFRVDGRLLAVLSSLSEWTSADELAAAGHAISAADLDRLVELGVVEDSSAHRTEASEEASPPTYWNPLELAVHRHQNVGGYRAADVEQRGDPPPAPFKARPPGPVTALPPPGELSAALGDVLSGRRSVRTYGDRALSLGELSTLLHHAARVVGVVPDDDLGDHVFRPFPGGGARSELEIYVVANQVEGLAAGAHYYDARAHDFVLVRRSDAHQEHMVRWVNEATGGLLNREPQAILVITAAFARIMWKYTGIGLGLIDRDTGCLYQTLYLVATALGLAPCAIGASEERDNARWLGLDPLVESQVGCFLLGTRSSEPIADSGGANKV